MRKISKYILIAFGLILTISCIIYYSGRHQPYKINKLPNDKAGRYFGSLANYSDFLKLSGEPLSNKFSNVESVKLVYDIKKRNLYFISSAKYRLHFGFCDEVLGYSGGLLAFNTNSYSDNIDQEYCLANLNFYKAVNRYALEFTSSSRYPFSQLEELFEAVIKNSYLKDSLTILMSSEYLNGIAGKLDLPKIEPSEIYKGQKYQPVQRGICYGILKKIEDLDKQYTQITGRDIIIIKGTPINVPLCQGIITDAFQTPLSHINVLCHNRKIPAAADVSIWTKKYVDGLEGKPVKMVVSDTGIFIKEIGLAEMNRFIQTGPTKNLSLTFDLNEKRLLPVSEIGLKNKNVVGNKSAGFGELFKISKKNKKLFETPEGGFAIPFYYYHQHISSPAIKKQIDKFFNDPIFIKDTDSLKKQLERIQEAIKDQAINPKLYDEVCRLIKENSVGNSYRFRSSSNAEDTEGFSGAGLYESKTGKLVDDKKSIDKAIKEVWASAWKYQAFVERAYFGIDQSTMMMGILVHRNFPDEKSNGVAITKNLYRDNFPGFTVNVQIGEISVVAPPPDVIAEQFVCTAKIDFDVFSDDINIDYITGSTITKGKPVLSKEEVVILYKSLFAIKQYFYKKTQWGVNSDYDDFALDMEFKFDKNGKLYIKQVRPY